MPLGASKLNSYALLDRIGAALTLAPDSPSGLRWSKTWATLRNMPGGVAGNWSEHQKSWVVTANSVPLHCRHAVWMLTHMQPIPDDKDIAFADGNPRNLDPRNLVVAEKLIYRNYGVRRPEAALPRVPHAYTVAAMPNSTMFSITLHLGRKAAMLALAPTREHAAMFMLIAGNHFGALAALPNLPMAPDLVAYVRQCCRGVGPTPTDLSGSEQEAARRLRTALSAEVPVLAALMTGAVAPPAPIAPVVPVPVRARPTPQARPAPVPSETPILDMLNALHPEDPAPAPNRPASSVSAAPEYPGGFDPLSTLPRAGE